MNYRMLHATVVLVGVANIGFGSTYLLSMNPQKPPVLQKKKKSFLYF